MGTLFVDKLDPQSGTSLELGSSGDTITIPSGATITNNGTSSGFGTTPVVGTSGFLAHGDGSTNQTISGAHSWTTITTFGTERYDIGGDFASNTFTAPAAGKYYLSFQLTFANISGTFLKLRLQPLANDLASNGTDGGDGNDHKTLGYSYIMDLTQGQTAYPQVYSSATTVQVINNNGSFFCGMRIA